MMSNAGEFIKLWAYIEVYCAFHLSALSHTVHALSLTLLQHSGTHFQQTSDFLRQFIPLDQHLRPTFLQHKDVVMID